MLLACFHDPRKNDSVENESTSEVDLANTPFNDIPVTLDADVEEFYNLLKSFIKGRVVNGYMAGCILESELKEIYEQFRRSR